MTTATNKIFTKPENCYRSGRIQLTSPLLHIGSEVPRLSPFEYVQHNNKIYLPNVEALARAFNEMPALKKVNPFERAKRGQQIGKALVQTGLLSEYVKAIQENDDRQIKQLLGTLSLEWWNHKDSRGVSIFPKNTISRNWTQGWLNHIRPMIRNGFGDLYIPGSSIKGAIRTAIAYYLLQHSEDYKLPQSLQPSQIELELRKKLGKIEQEKGKGRKVDQNSNKENLSGENYIKHLFSDFIFTYKGRQFVCESESNSNFMRAIRVSDSEPLLKVGQAKNLSVVAEVVTSSFTTNGDRRVAKYAGDNKYFTNVEMVWNVEAEFTLSIDIEMLKWFENEQGIQIPSKLKTVAGLIEICEEFAKAQWKHERNYWNRLTDNPSDQTLDFSPIRELYSQKCDYSLRLGWASGMTGTTIDLQFKEPTRASIRNACGKPTDSSEAPKSRRTVVIPTKTGVTKEVLGWAQLKVLSLPG